MMLYVVIAVATTCFLCLIVGADFGSARTYSEMAARQHAIESSRIMADVAREIAIGRSIQGRSTRRIGDGGN